MRVALRRLRQAMAGAARDVRWSVATGAALILLLVFAGVTTVVAHAVIVKPRHAAAESPTFTAKVHTSRPSASPTPVATAADPSGPNAANGATTPVTRRPQVPRPHHLVQATLLARQDKPLTAAQIKALKQISGVQRVEVLGDGTATIDGHQARTIAVNPAGFRPWTPSLTAKSNPLWSSIASGEVTASFDMAKGVKLPLGQTVPMKATKTQPARIGALATVGMAGVNAVVDNARARSIGLPTRNAVVISAPKANPLTLKAAVAEQLGKGASTSLLREVIVIRDAGEFMTRKQIATIIRVAASRIGMPYVWGAAGPKSFDCSGLVQWTFAHAGITMPRVSEEQWFTGPHVPYADARPGDLLFWHYDPTDPGDIDHVAIYIGDGKMIVAPHTGLDVMIAPVPLDHMAGVVRVDPSVAERVG